MPPPREPLQARLDAITRLLERHRLLESLVERQSTAKRDLLEQMQRRENLVELQRHLRGIHPADLAGILASLPTEERLLVFRQLESRDAGLTLVELEPEIRETVIEGLSRDEIATAVRELDADDLAYLADALPADVYRNAAATLQAADRSWTVDPNTFPEDSVGRLMRRDVVALRADQPAGDALEALRQGGPLPDQTDRLFVVDARHLFRGSVLLQDLVRAQPATPLAALAIADAAAFVPSDAADRAMTAFERYDLLSAPVVDELGKLIGRITIDAVVDYQRSLADEHALARAGLRGAEDLFAPVVESVRNRWPWLAINLLTAFIASRVIGAFEETIAQVVALAALMPIVASIGGNTGNQTVALVVRALALDQLAESPRRLLRKELAVGAVNGAMWGAVVGLAAWLFYRELSLAGVMAAAVFLNLAVAALAGVLVPLGLRRFGRDPAQGASVVLTFVTDGMGFFLLLGLARLALT
jgi:magnesium transporter